MEVSDCEAAFDSRGLNPRLFINEVLNSVDDLVDGAFDFFAQGASEIVGDSAGSGEFAGGVSSLRNITHAVLDKRLTMWEKYCFQHIFVVPEGFSSHETDTSGFSSVPEDILSDADIDSQLQALREKIAAAERESEKLKKEKHLLEKQSISLNEYVKSLKDASPLHETISMMKGLFQELEKTAPTFYDKFSKLRGGIDDNKNQVTYFASKQQSVQNAGFSPLLEDLQQALGILRKAETWESSA